MTEPVKKAAKAPAKPRKTTIKKTANGSTNGSAKVTEMPMPTVPAEQVAILAHSYFEQRGGQHGHHMEDWYRAEQELRGKAS